MSVKNNHVESALEIIILFGFPKQQQNERSALCLLALLNLKPDAKWSSAENPVIGITPIMTWIRDNYGKEYAPNSRETIRRHSMHQFCDAGIALYNPDAPVRPVNSPKAIYQIESETLALLQTFGTPKWLVSLTAYLSQRQSLVAHYAKERAQNQIPVNFGASKKISISPGDHSELIKAVIEEFAPRFAPGSDLVYVGDTGKKWGYFDEPLLSSLGVRIDTHGKMPDVVFYFSSKNWLLLVESVTSHGPINGKRNTELAKLFANSTAGLVFVTAFPTRATMSRYLSEIAWETEVWVAEAPSHLIHFNGVRFLGPY